MKLQYCKLFLFFFVVVIFFLLRNYFSLSFIYVDDLYTSICDSFNNILKEPSNGIYIASFFDKLFTTCLPRFFDVHPSVFKGQYFSYIESILVLSFIFIFSAIFYIKKKIDFFYLICFLFCSSLFFYIVQQQSFVLFVYDGFFRMLLPVFIWLGLFYLIVSLDEVVTKKKLFFIGIVSFLTCISNEMLCVSTVIGLMVYSIFQLRKKKYKSILLFLCSILGCFVLIKTGAFLRKSNGGVPDILPYLSDFGSFICDYVKHIFSRHVIELFFVVLQVLFLLLEKRNEEKVRNTILLIFSMFIGILGFYFSLIFLGRTHYEENQYWIVHQDLHMIYSFMLAAFNLALLRLIVDYELVSKKIVCLLFAIASSYLMVKNYCYYESFFREQILPTKIEYYKSEKILRLAAKNGEMAILDYNNTNNSCYWPFLYNVFDYRKNVKYDASPFIIFMNQFEDENNKMKHGFMFSDIEKVEKEFKNNGGSFTEEELENLDFSNLK